MTPSGKRDEFFIGYEPPLPPLLAGFIRRVVLSGGGALVVGVAVIAIGHLRLDGGAFEFGNVSAVTGTIVERPYPALIPDRERRISGDSETTNQPWTLLVAPGKHGAGGIVRGLHGVRVTLEGTRIERDGRRMIEVQPDSIVRAETSAPDAPVLVIDTESAGVEGSSADRVVALRGEIVDSKCFLGVMTPGDGRTHAACASLCVRGGIPPALLVRDRAGRSALFLLEDLNGEPLAARAAAVAGEPLALRGVIAQRGSWRVLRTDPSTWTRVGGSR